MKVLTVTNMLPYTGKIYYGIFVKEQIDALSYYYPDINNTVWFIKGYISKINYILSVVSLNWHLLFHKYDLIHIHSALSGIFLLFAPKRKNVIITLHGTEVLDSKQYIVSKLVISRAKHLISVSDEIARRVKKDFPNANHYTLPCGVLDRFFVDERWKEKDIIKIAFTSGKWREVKNYPLFEEIISQLGTIFKQEIRVVMFDNKTREEVRDDLNSVDLLLMTSFHEGSPQIVKEAMCCNTPVVSSNVGTVKFMLEGVENCFVVDGYNPKDYVEVIVKLLSPEKTTFPIRSTGRKRNYDLGNDEKTITLRVMQIYEDVISQTTR